MAFDVDFTTPLGQVRVNIGDVSEPYEIADNMILQMLDAYEGSVLKTTLELIKFLLVVYARKIDQEVGDVRFWYSQRYRQLKDLFEDMTNDPAMLPNAPLHYFGDTTKSEKCRVNKSPERVYTGIKIGEFSKTHKKCVSTVDPYSIFSCD